jgi:transcriptional regulator with XRE-family HTH domain
LTDVANLLYRVITIYSNAEPMRLREIRKQKGLTQRQIADKLKMSSTYLCNLENGKENVSLTTLRRLAKVLKVRVAELVEDE